jgi:ELWxxDGT repeat protein
MCRSRRPGTAILGVVLALVTVVASAPGAAAEDRLDRASGSHAREFTALGDQLLFAADDGVHGGELWRTDGSRAGTRLLLDIRPGSRGSRPVFLTMLGDRVFFRADDGVHGQELWATDGTTDGTRMVRDIGTGTGDRAGSWPRNLTPVGDRLFFTLYRDGANELWRSDGSETGTRRVFRPITGTRWEPAELTALGDLLLFRARDPEHGTELWRSDGTPGGTARLVDLQPGTASSVPDDLVRLGDRVLFKAGSPGTGRELWRTDGTAEGTRLVRDIRPGGRSSALSHLRVLNGAAWFRADDGVHGQELWRSDGTRSGTRLVADIAPGSSGSYPSYLGQSGIGQVGTSILFAADAAADGVHGHEPWITDGTRDGTRRLMDIRPGPKGSHPELFTAVGARTFFRATDGIHGEELWVTDGTRSGTRMVKDITAGSSNVVGRYPDLLRAFKGTVVFRQDDVEHGPEPWISDGTTDGTRMLRDINP